MLSNKFIAALLCISILIIYALPIGVMAESDDVQGMEAQTEETTEDAPAEVSAPIHFDTPKIGRAHV